MNGSRNGIIIGVVVAFIIGALAGVMTERSRGAKEVLRRPCEKRVHEKEKKFSKESYLNELATEITLSTEQKDKAREILNENESGFMALREDMRGKYAELRKKTRGQIRDILDGEQQKKYDAYIERMDEGCKKPGDRKKCSECRDKEKCEKCRDRERCRECRDNEKCKECRDKKKGPECRDRAKKSDAGTTGERGEHSEEAYGLKTGDKAPDFSVAVSDGSTFHMEDALSKGLLVLVFYRGGWCPFCQLQIRELQMNVDEIRKRGATLVALSVDKVESARETVEKENLGFPLLSDPDADVLKDYRLTLMLDDEILKKYEEYGIDVEKASGRTHHQIAVPAVYIIDKGAIIRWSYVNVNYKERAKMQDILDALEKL